MSRLEILPVTAIKDRMDLWAFEGGVAMPPPVSYSRLGHKGLAYGRTPTEVWKAFGGAAVRALWEVRKSPTAEELAELSLFDWYYPKTAREMKASAEDRSTGQHWYLKVCLERAYKSGPQLQKTPGAWVQAGSDACTIHFPSWNVPFYWPHPYGVGFQGAGRAATPQKAWGQHENGQWGTKKLIVSNIAHAESVMNNYPWPNPRRTFRSLWGEDKYGTRGWKDFRNFILSGDEEFSADLIKTSITLSIIKHWKDLAGGMEDYIEHKERAAKIDAIIHIVGGIAMGAIMAIFAPSIIGNVFSILKTTIETVDKVQAAQGMAMLAKQFAERDIEFSRELDRTAHFLDAQTAEAEKKAALSKAEIDAMAEGKGKYLVYVEGASVGSAKNTEEASALAMKSSKPGERIEVLFEGRSTGYFVRMGDSVLPIGADQIEGVKAASKEELKKVVEEKEKRGTPWWAILGTGAAIIAVSSLK